MASAQPQRRGSRGLARRCRIRLTSTVFFTFAATAGAGLAAPLGFGLLAPAQAQAVLAAGILPAFIGLMLLWATVHFWRRLTPAVEWLDAQSPDAAIPSTVREQLLAVPRDYWGLFLIYGLGTPLIFQYSGIGLAGRGGGFIDLLWVELAVAAVVGLPGYLLTLDDLGRLLARTGLDRVQVSLKSKLMVLGGLLPLLGYALLAYYFYIETGDISTGLLAILAGVAAVTVTVSALATRSINRSLQPVQRALTHEGALDHAELARIQPASTDEIGVLTQMLARVFRRLREQSSHLRAVVDNAAEGIIVVNEQGRIETFNPTAERLFGHTQSQIQGRPLAWVLPGLMASETTPRVEPGEQEIEGVHRDGLFVPMSVRVSEMVLHGRHLYTCLVADISARKATEDKLRAAEARYRDLVETAHDLVWSLDANGNWTFVNNASRSVYGYAPEEMIGRAITDFSAPEYAEEDHAAFSRLLAGGELVQYETVHIDRHGQPHNLSFNAKAHQDNTGHVVRISGMARDITAQKDAERQLTYNTEHDTLTGLFNRPYFHQELERVVARDARRGIRCAVLYVDLDLFKYINDTVGHIAGDDLLVETAGLLAGQTRDGDLLARFGGDEFTLLIYNITAEEAYAQAQAFHQLLADYKYSAGGRSYNITTSIGVAMIDEDTRSADEALAHADLACNLAKAQGRNRVHIYDPRDLDKAGMAADMGWAARVREMLEHDRVQLVFQPIFSLRDGRVREYEVLMRMLSEDGRTILPSGFMPAAERFGLIHNVDRWLVRKAIQRLADMPPEVRRAVRLSINLSGRSFEDNELLPLIRQQLDETKVDPGLLTFEITETAAIVNLSAASRFIRALKRMGCQFALDDFGSGFCSFNYLKHLPVDKLKIDGSFVQGLAHTPVDQAMVRSMNQIAHALGKVTIAEYVENARTMRLLKDYGVDFAQGYYLGYPAEQLPQSA